LLIAAASVGAWEYHETPQFCGNTCHIMQPYVDTWEGDHLLAARHAEAGVECLDCHMPTMEDQISQIEMYVEGSYEQPLETRKFENDWCFRCHEHDSYEAIAEKTEYLVDEVNRNPHNSPHYNNLECYTCHNMHQQGEIYCSTCHNFPAQGTEWKEMPVPEWPIP
jgi:formate-dependent nitrite reductase cytochrome c552 subunit